MPPDPQVDDRSVVAEIVYRTLVYEADVARLRALGCRCLLRCVYSSGVRAIPLNELVAETCTVDHRARS